jgi:hypothetical protein
VRQRHAAEVTPVVATAAGPVRASLLQPAGNLDRVNAWPGRAELAEHETSMTVANDLAVRRALEAAGVEFIDGNGGGPGVRLRKAHQYGKRK